MSRTIMLHAWLTAENGDQNYCEPDHPKREGWSVYIREQKSNDEFDTFEEHDFQHRADAEDYANRLSGWYEIPDIEVY